MKFDGYIKMPFRFEISKRCGSKFAFYKWANKGFSIIAFNIELFVMPIQESNMAHSQRDINRNTCKRRVRKGLSPDIDCIECKGCANNTKSLRIESNIVRRRRQNNATLLDKEIPVFKSDREWWD